MFPLLNADKSELPIIVLCDSSATDGHEIIWIFFMERNNFPVIWMALSIKVAKFIYHIRFTFNKIYEILRVDVFIRWLLSSSLWLNKAFIFHFFCNNISLWLHLRLNWYTSFRFIRLISVNNNSLLFLIRGLHIGLIGIDLLIRRVKILTKLSLF